MKKPDAVAYPSFDLVNRGLGRHVIQRLRFNPSLVEELSSMAAAAALDILEANLLNEESLSHNWYNRIPDFLDEYGLAIIEYVDARQAFLEG